MMMGCYTAVLNRPVPFHLSEVWGGVGLLGGQVETTAIIHWGGNGGSGSRC